MPRLPRALLLGSLALAAGHGPGESPPVTPAEVAARSWTTWGGHKGYNPSVLSAQVAPIVNPGDTVFLRAYSGKHIDAEGETLRARRDLHGVKQAFIMEKAEQGPIVPGDMVFLRASTGMRVEVEGDAVRARNQHRGPKQALVLERWGDAQGPVRAGDTLFFMAHTGRRLGVVGELVQARWPPIPGSWQGFRIEKPAASL